MPRAKSRAGANRPSTRAWPSLVFLELSAGFAVFGGVSRGFPGCGHVRRGGFVAAWGFPQSLQPGISDIGVTTAETSQNVLVQGGRPALLSPGRLCSCLPHCTPLFIAPVVVPLPATWPGWHLASAIPRHREMLPSPECPCTTGADRPAKSFPAPCCLQQPALPLVPVRPLAQEQQGKAGDRGTRSPLGPGKWSRTRPAAPPCRRRG